MPNWFERYQQGSYQEVYTELLTLQEAVFEEPVYQEALLVAREIMRRARSNIEILVPRLLSLGYQFVDDDWSRYDWEKGKLIVRPQQDLQMEEKYRIFRVPPAETPALLEATERLVGELPLSVRCWYEEVGSVNFIGIFPETATRYVLSEVLDPLLITPIEDLSEQFPFETREEWEEARDTNGLLEIDLAVDAPLKYNASGSGGYAIKTPCRAFDTVIDLIYYGEPQTFIDYLRACFRWGGLFGLSNAQPGQGLSSEELTFLTRDLLPF